jgi:Tlde1 domain
MWIWVQATGELIAEGGATLAHGYSGRDAGHNNPALQQVPMIGPLPEGTYTIHSPRVHPHLGPFVMSLSPYPGNQMFGRSAFYIHGDSLTHPGHASDGCIILARDAREAIWDSGDHTLRVIAGEPTSNV